MTATRLDSDGFAIAVICATIVLVVALLVAMAIGVNRYTSQRDRAVQVACVSHGSSWIDGKCLSRR